MGRWVGRALCNEEPFRFGNFRISLKQVLNPRPRDPKPGALPNHFIYSFFFYSFFSDVGVAGVAGVAANDDEGNGKTNM